MVVSQTPRFTSRTLVVTFVFHTHLPYVLHHGTWPFGSDWLCEAVAECYVPLLEVCNRLLRQHIPVRITVSISPILAEQLAHPTFPALFREYCANHARMARADADAMRESQHDQGLVSMAEFWSNWYTSTEETFTEVYNGNIIEAFANAQASGMVELITCGATHGYFPLLAEDASIDLQIRTAIASHKKHFGTEPKGMWLPECAYRPAYSWRTLLSNTPYGTERFRQGVEHLLRSYGVEYFITDQAALEQATPLGTRAGGKRTAFQHVHGYHRLALTERSPLDVFLAASNLSDDAVAVFTRHQPLAMQVWSGERGYPGDPDYLDFHKKYSQSALRYWRVTNNQADMSGKQPYMHEWASARAQMHAEHYVHGIASEFQQRKVLTGRDPVVCLPFDTELFGHWWFEGPEFLEHVFRGIAEHPWLNTTSCSDVLLRHPVVHEIALPESSWGANGNHSVWMNADTQWMWQKEYNAEYRVRMLVEKHPPSRWNDTMQRVMCRVFCDLLLLQASDWPFLVTNQTARSYAEERFANHVSDLLATCTLAELVMVTGTLDSEQTAWLEEHEQRNNVFREEILDYINKFVDQGQ
jgi:1,4-alpha-glucan branching enzyme